MHVAIFHCKISLEIGMEHTNEFFLSPEKRQFFTLFLTSKVKVKSRFDVFEVNLLEFG